MFRCFSSKADVLQLVPYGVKSLGKRDLAKAVGEKEGEAAKNWQGCWISTISTGTYVVPSFTLF